MSFNAKNLAYEAKEPAFLQRLKGQYGGASGGLQRPVSQRPRRLRDDNDDDGPTIVDAASNEVITKEEYEAMINSGSNEQAGESGNDEEGQEKSAAETAAEGSGSDPKKDDGPTSKQNLAEIGGPRKRKQAKVVGEEAQDDQGEEARPKDPAPRKPKQKKKKIKLSFED